MKTVFTKSAQSKSKNEVQLRRNLNFKVELERW